MPKQTQRVKIALCGLSVVATSRIVRHAAKKFGNGQIRFGEVAGAKIYRCHFNWPGNAQGHEVRLFAIEGDASYHAVWDLLFQESQAIVCCFPLTPLAHTQADDRLSFFFRRIAAQKIELLQFPFVIQYLQLGEHSVISAADFDDVLGLTASNLTRLSTSETGSDSINGIIKALEIWHGQQAVRHGIFD